MTQKDLNLFSAYKKNTSGSGAKGYRGIILMATAFILVVALAYGTLFILKAGIQKEISDIQFELNDPQVSKLQKELEREIARNNLMARYKKGLTEAVKKYSESKVIDKVLYDDIISAAPSDTLISSISIDASVITLNCTSVGFNSAGTFAQSLSRKEKFTSVAFNSVRANADGKYEFSLVFGFKGGDSK